MDRNMKRPIPVKNREATPVESREEKTEAKAVRMVARMEEKAAVKAAGKK